MVIKHNTLYFNKKMPTCLAKFRKNDNLKNVQVIYRTKKRKENRTCQLCRLWEEDNTWPNYGNISYGIIKQ